MTSEWGAARSSDLYTADLNLNTEPLEPAGPLERLEPLESGEPSALDARIAIARAELLETNRELNELLLVRPEESGSGILGQLTRFCDTATEGIARFLSSLFQPEGTPKVVRETELAEVLQRLELRKEELQDLEAVRTELLEVRTRLQEVRDPDHAATRPLLEQFRTELTPVPDLLKEFAWTPIAPVEPPAPNADLVAPSLWPTVRITEVLENPIPGPTELSEVRTTVVGDPEADAAYWHPQAGDMTCAIVDQEMILDKLKGDPSTATEFNLVQEAVAKGWARADGATTPACVGFLLREHGVATETVTGEDVSRLAQRLAAGEEAIVGVRGEILWGVEPVQSGSDVNPANHAVWVTGATVVERNGVSEVVSLHINDSGHPNGRGREVPVELFLRAWSASDHHVVYARPEQR